MGEIRPEALWQPYVRDKAAGAVLKSTHPGVGVVPLVSERSVVGRNPELVTHGGVSAEEPRSYWCPGD